MILLTVLSLNIFGDGLRDALDPKSKSKLLIRAEAAEAAAGWGDLMARFVIRRLAGMVLVLFAVSVLVFAIFNLIPNSDPAQRMAGKNADAVLVKSIEEDWGFDEPLPVQYWETMKKIFTGELISYGDQLNVDERIVEGLPATFSLGDRRGRDLDVLRHPLRLSLGDQGRAAGSTVPSRSARWRESRSRSF